MPWKYSTWPSWNTVLILLHLFDRPFHGWKWHQVSGSDLCRKVGRHCPLRWIPHPAPVWICRWKEPENPETETEKTLLRASNLSDVLHLEKIILQRAFTFTMETVTGCFPWIMPDRCGAYWQNSILTSAITNIQVAAIGLKTKAWPGRPCLTISNGTPYWMLNWLIPLIFQRLTQQFSPPISGYIFFNRNSPWNSAVSRYNEIWN